MTAKQKLTLYLPPNLLQEAKLEAERQERTVSWILQKAWEYAKKDIKNMPGAGEPIRNVAPHQDLLRRN